MPRNVCAMATVATVPSKTEDVTSIDSSMGQPATRRFDPLSAAAQGCGRTFTSAVDDPIGLC